MALSAPIRTETFSTCTTSSDMSKFSIIKVTQRLNEPVRNRTVVSFARSLIKFVDNKTVFLKIVIVNVPLGSVLKTESVEYTLET